MKLTVDRATFLSALDSAVRVVEKRTTIPIMANVKLVATGASLSLTSSDLDIESTTTIAATAETAGMTTLPAHTLRDIVRKMKGQTVAIESAEHAVRVTAGRSRFELAPLPAEDFPVLSAGDMPHSFDITKSDLQALIDRVSFAISTEETRYYLNGIYLHPSDNVLRAATTDGHRLARADVALPEGAAAMPGVIIPKKAVKVIRDLCAGTGGDLLRVSVSGNKIRLACGGTTILSKLIDGTFPDYNRVVPTGNTQIFEINRAEFAESAMRAAVARDDGSTVKIDVNVDGCGITVSASSGGGVSYTENVDAKLSISESIAIGFAGRYLMDTLAQVHGDVVRVALADSGSPVVFTGVGDESALFVIMPRRV